MKVDINKPLNETQMRSVVIELLHPVASQPINKSDYAILLSEIASAYDNLTGADASGEYRPKDISVDSLVKTFIIVEIELILDETIHVGDGLRFWKDIASVIWQDDTTHD